MRSSKSRSRSKSNRNRSMGNIVNRVFDSSGPEGKVRGTPQQIIDKYNQLARDAQLSNDRVATENFQQHAEHYTRMLSEAQREQEARREQQEKERGERQNNNQNNQNNNQGGNQGGGDQNQRRDRQERDGPIAVSDPDAPQPDVAATAPGGDSPFVGGEASGLVETPESQPAPKPRRNRRKKDAPESEAAEAKSPDAPEAQEAAE